MKMCKDGFVWKIITHEQAIDLFINCKSMQVFCLYDDDSESLVETKDDLDKHISGHGKFGIEVGFIGGERKTRTFVFGEDAVNEYQYGSKDLKVLDDMGEVIAHEFSDAEYKIYIQGLNDAEGWLNNCEYEQ
ncbi:MAG: hypothetical protein ACRDD8_06405 [Bacteroidales bacterium]